MGTAYSDDLRRKLLEAHQRGEGSLSQLARRFSVSHGWALKISSQRHRTGKMERPPGRRRGPVSKVTAEIQQELQGWIAKQPDLTLAELQLRLYEQRNLEVSVSRLWMVLRSLGLRLKKSHSTPPSRTPKGVVSNVRTGAKLANRSTRQT
jgi:transposase